MSNFISKLARSARLANLQRSFSSGLYAEQRSFTDQVAQQSESRENSFSTKRETLITAGAFEAYQNSFSTKRPINFTIGSTGSGMSR